MITGYLKEAEHWVGSIREMAVPTEKMDNRSEYQIPTVLRSQQTDLCPIHEICVDGVPYSAVDTMVFNGEQYVDLGFNANENTKIEIVAELKSFAKFLFGARSGANANDQFGLYLGSGTSFVQFGSSNTASLGLLSGKRYTFELSKEGLKIDGQSKFTVSDIPFSGSCSLVVGSCNTNGTLDSRLFVGNVSYIKIYEKKALKMQLMPMKTATNALIWADVINGMVYPMQNTVPAVNSMEE